MIQCRCQCQCPCAQTAITDAAARQFQHLLTSRARGEHVYAVVFVFCFRRQASAHQVTAGLNHFTHTLAHDFYAHSTCTHCRLIISFWPRDQQPYNYFAQVQTAHVQRQGHEANIMSCPTHWLVRRCGPGRKPSVSPWPC